MEMVRPSLQIGNYWIQTYIRLFRVFNIDFTIEAQCKFSKGILDKYDFDDDNDGIPDDKDQDPV